MSGAHEAARLRAVTDIPAKPASVRTGGDEDDIAHHLHDGLRARLSGGDRDGAIDFGRRLRAYLTEHGHRLDGARAAWLLHTLSAEALMYEGKLQALTDLHKAAGFASAAGNSDLVARAFERVAVIHAAQGRLREADKVLRREMQRPGAENSVFLRAARALSAVESLDPKGGSLISSIDLDELPDPYWPLLLLGRARWAIAHSGVTLALETAAVARTAKPVRPLSLADSLLLSIRVMALTAMGGATTASRELAGMSLFATPELELARARADLQVGSSLRALGVIRRLATSEDAGPSLRAEAMLVSLQSDPLNAVTIGAVRALVELEGIRRVKTTAAEPTVRQVWPDMAERLPVGEGHAQIPQLRDSELRVLEMLSDRGDMAEIARSLHISKNTLKTHVRAIYQKLGVASRGEAVSQAYLRGLLTADASEEPPRI